MSSYYRQQLEHFLSLLSVRAGTVYDIGGAQGEVKGRVGDWQVDDYKVLDLPEFNLDIYWGDDQDKVGYLEKADTVFCLEVFEYLINPNIAMSNIYQVLKEGGKAYVTFAFVYPHHNELEMDMLRYTEMAVRRLADLNMLSVEQIWYREDRSGLLESFYSADRMHPAKQYRHHNATGFIVELKK
jgi:SAM-dependent methyltransferase